MQYINNRETYERRRESVKKYESSVHSAKPKLSVNLELL